MDRTRRLLRRLPRTTLIVGVAMVTTWVAASVALSNLKPDVLAADLQSSLEADYGPSDAGGSRLGPVDNAIANSVAEDERDRSHELGASDVVFAPIYLAGEGNQEPARLPSGEVEPVPTPLPTQPGQPTAIATATPLPPDQPTQQPKATKEVQPTSTPKPQPTQPDHPTPPPKPTQAVEPTSTPRPTSTDRPTSTPRPTKTDRPTSTPKVKPTKAQGPSANP